MSRKVREIAPSCQIMFTVLSLRKSFSPHPLKELKISLSYWQHLHFNCILSSPLKDLLLIPLMKRINLNTDNWDKENTENSVINVDKT